MCDLNTKKSDAFIFFEQTTHIQWQKKKDVEYEVYKITFINT